MVEMRILTHHLAVTIEGDSVWIMQQTLPAENRAKFLNSLQCWGPA